MGFEVVESDRNMLVPWYLMAAYVYYHLDDNLITDAQFDWTAKEILANYDFITHRHKHLITKEELEAGTLLLAEENYPAITKDSARYLLAIKQEEKTRCKARKNKKQ